MSRLVRIDQRERVALNVARAHVKYRMECLANAAGGIKKAMALQAVVFALTEIITRFDEADDPEPIAAADAAEAFAQDCAKRRREQ